MSVTLSSIPAKTKDDESRDFFAGQYITLEATVEAGSAPDGIGAGPYTFDWRLSPVTGGVLLSPTQSVTTLVEPRPLGQRTEPGKQVFVFGWSVEEPEGAIHVFVTEPGVQAKFAPATVVTLERPGQSFQDAAEALNERTAVLTYTLRDVAAPLLAQASAEAISRNGGFSISLQREPAPPGSRVDEGLWVRILASTRAISFPTYVAHLNTRGIDFADSGTAAYADLKKATHAFLKAECQAKSPSGLGQAEAEAAVRLRRSFAGDRSTSLPSVDLVKDRLPLAGDLEPLSSLPATPPRAGAVPPRNTFSYRPLCLVELIWSYWHEEAMLVQTIKAVSRRFQNRLAPGARDPLQGLEIDPLRPLSNLFWGYIQDEQYRISVLRRAHEYEHHYGISLHGKVVRGLRPADRRTKFLESFHNLLFRCLQFYRQDDDKTVSADGFPVLNSIKETHYLINHGAHNQFGDLPETDREEKLVEMYLLARDEMREFLRGRPMVPYPETWMDRVDHMKSLQGWTDVSVVHFHDLAVFGEQLLLAIRYGSWSTQNDPLTAVAWARFWRQEVQGYIHAYRATTGVDLSTEITDPRMLEARSASPSLHLSRRLAAQGSR